jgi:sigma-B regulation protein RsbU (phosphoserine phosphatase)
MEFPLRGADGEYRWFLTRIRPLRDNDGQIVSWFGTNTNIESRKRAAEFQERFVAILAHDLRNPLAAIDMGVALLRRTAEPRAARVIGRLESSTARMSRMIEQILDFTRSRLGGGLEVRPTSVDLREVLTQVIDEIRSAHPSRAIVLECPSPIEGVWDRDRLEQVFSNLIANAIHHGLAGTVATVAARVDGSRVMVSVHNDGLPIPEDLRSKLFDPFRRGSQDSRTAQTAGLGLGLFISREIVIAHAGSIDVQSTAASGTTFRVELPLVSTLKTLD